MVVFIICFCILYFIVSSVLSFRYDDGVLQMEQFYRQPRGSIDVLVLGSSHAFVDVDPQILHDEAGVNAYDLGASMQYMWHTYYDLEEALKYQKPKLIVLDVFRMIETFDYSKESKLIKSVYGMRPSITKLNSIKAGLEKNDTFEAFKYFFRLPVSHGKYEDLKKEDFDLLQKPDKDYKGHYSAVEVTPKIMPDVSAVTDRYPIEEKTKEYFLMILDKAGEEDIPVLLINVPYMITEDDKMVYNSLEDVLGSYNGKADIKYLDFNLPKMYEELGLDFSTDFADDDHLNKGGTDKLGSFLARYIKENYRIGR